MTAAAPDRLLAKRYRLLRPVAKHAHTTLWRGVDEVLARPVAIKTLDDPKAVPGGADRFLAAAIAAGGLSHPRIASVYDADKDKGLPFMVTEWVDGTVLEDLLADGAVSAPRATTIAAQVTEAVLAAHTAGVHHLDLDAQNILLCADGSVKITDFAVGATVADAEGSAAGSDLTDVERDTRALGALLYACLTGRSAYGAEPKLPLAPRRKGALLSPRQVRPTVPKALDEVVARVLQPETVPAKKRLATPTHLLRELAALPGEGAKSGSRPPPAHVPGKARTRWLTVGAPLAAVVCAGVIALLVGRSVGRVEGPGRRFVQPVPTASADIANAPGAPVIPTAVRDWDPYGDGTENQGRVLLSFDNDPSTAWTTSGYTNQFGQFKPGVGLMFDLGQRVSLGTVQVALAKAGVALEIRVTDTLDPTRPTRDLPPVVGTLPSGTQDVATVTLPAGTAGRYWLVWVTQLVRDSGGLHRGGLAEVTFYRS